MSTTKKQKRRTVSLSGSTYAALRAHCQARGLAMAAVVEAEVQRLLKAARPAQPEPTPAPAPWRSTEAF
jgi:hypothetical protein